ncbi:hypothetical protein, partial [Escherichia coli]|uniref:hypothetical protein n=1 Tax=Escherichia coli TaxID=562 RepID=UPI00287822E1
SYPILHTHQGSKQLAINHHIHTNQHIQRPPLWHKKQPGGGGMKEVEVITLNMLQLFLRTA